ncbi:Zinc finger protein Noc [Temnothorax longispinosus]|uniref:Zinc finger protein Noc n=1 Tax=Temnothorax longispinosus TaxID=300112 RepID=A0A4S2L1U8_9HYME|nr:Zinc finger protein Noc [Temnothorax longispinosus]
MVVLEEGSMLTTGHNQYLQPDYLSPLSTTLDAKKSPLALLAQTCSQIGADSPTKPLISPLEKNSKGMSIATNAKSPPAAKMERNTRGSPTDGKSLAFKPYEVNVVTKKTSDEGRPTSKASVHSVSGQDSVSVSDNTHPDKKSSGNRTPVSRNMHSAQIMMGAGSCPSGCTQCDHQKYGLAMALSSLGPMPPPSLSYPSTLAGGRPYVCNWIAGESYCGKRFATSEELLQHLRSHTSLTGGDHAAAAASAAALLGNPHPHPLLSPSTTLHRASGGSYPAPSLSPLGARYHPYGKPPTGPLPASLAASPYSAFNALGPYYSPYAVYGQRIGAAVHP